MGLQERSYSGTQFRPTPEVHVQDDGAFGVIATPWGNRQSAKKVVEILRDHILSARQDMEATSPFQKLTCLSPLANNLRAGIMLANDILYREENKSEHATGVEILVFAQAQGELAFAQVGSPQLFLVRSGFPWIPVSVQIDLATELSVPPEVLAPLPHNVLGLHTTSNMNVSSFKTQPADRLIFLSHSIVSHPMSTLASEEATLETITTTLSRQYPDLPFWLGLFDVHS
jgi:hypothetical protein